MHRLPGCNKSFYNKLYKALWCLNIYGAWVSLEGCQSTNNTKSCGATPNILSWSQSKGYGGLAISTKRGAHKEDGLLMSASSSITSHRPPLLVDSIDLANKHTAVWPLLTRRKQTNFFVSKLPSLPLSGTTKQSMQDKHAENINGQETKTDVTGCNLTWLLRDSWSRRSMRRLQSKCRCVDSEPHRWTPSWNKQFRPRHRCRQLLNTVASPNECL